MSRKDTALFVLLCLWWGFAFIAVKEALHFMQPIAFTAVRLWGATAVVFAWCIVRGHPLFPAPHQVFRALVLGIVSLGLVNVLTSLALGSLAAGLGAVLLYTYPLIAAVLAAAFLKERPGALGIAGLLVGFGGVVMISGLAGQWRPGAVLMLAAAICWAVGTVMFKLVAKGQDLMTMAAWSVLAAAVCASVLAAATEGEPQIRLSWTLVMAIAYTAVLASGAAWMLWYSLLDRGEAAVASSFLFLTPVFSLLFGIALLGEQFQPLEVAGIAGVLAGIFFVSRDTQIRSPALAERETKT
jgi:drug/metabolite transporter (DMT)-like permease